MARKFSRRLVIDASAAFRAGERTSGAKLVRDFLVEARRICHRVVVTPPILAEWQQHASPFARGWLTLMRSLGKEVALPGEAGDPDPLHTAVGKLSMPDTGKKEMAKDLPLVEAALGTDRLVVSCDDEARRLFRTAAAEIRQLRQIVWVNPASDAESPIQWLRAGARADMKRRLSSLRADQA